jgi:hypothetical protein
MRDQHHARLHHHADGRKIALEIVEQRFAQMRIHRDRPAVADEQRIAVGG